MSQWVLVNSRQPGYSGMNIWVYKKRSLILLHFYHNIPWYREDEPGQVLRRWTCRASICLIRAAGWEYVKQGCTKGIQKTYVYANTRIKHLLIIKIRNAQQYRFNSCLINLYTLVSWSLSQFNAISNIKLNSLVFLISKALFYLIGNFFSPLSRIKLNNVHKIFINLNACISICASKFKLVISFSLGWLFAVDNSLKWFIFLIYYLIL